MTATANTPAFLAVDFYCGAGGTTRGLIDAGGYVVAGIDKDYSCRTTYQSNNRNTALDGEEPVFIAKDMFPKSAEYPEGQQGEILEELARLVGSYRFQNPGVPLMFSICAPCQSFTKFVQPHMTHARESIRQRDQNLLEQALTFVEHFKPEMILSENVAGISRGKYKAVWERFQYRLKELGYTVGSGDVNAVKFGVPQKRRRAIMLAVQMDEPTGREYALLVPSEGPRKQTLTVKEAIGNLPGLQAGESDADVPNHRCRNLTAINLRRLMAVKPGDPNFLFPEDLQLECHRRLSEKGQQGFGDVYTRLHPDRPAPTITTRFHSISNGRFGHYDPEQPRGLSLHEGALLQSFPADYHFHGTSMDTVAKMIGNAVPPKLSEFMARHLAELYSTGIPK